MPCVTDHTKPRQQNLSWRRERGIIYIYIMEKSELASEQTSCSSLLLNGTGDSVLYGHEVRFISMDKTSEL